ncbi:MAG: D-Ala-D-Ala carboxypeptidase family metallohydrolase, partial [Thermoanaerobaculia bacterium]
VNRGFSTPRHNAKIKGAAKNSQHLYGTAADIDSDASDWHAKRDAARDAGACLEPLAISGYGHVHGDWREQCPPGW